MIVNVAHAIRQCIALSTVSRSPKLRSTSQFDLFVNDKADLEIGLFAAMQTCVLAQSRLQNVYFSCYPDDARA